MSCKKTTIIDTSAAPCVAKISPPRGFSSYEIAVQQGFVGTKDEWLDSLRAPENLIWDDLFTALSVEIYNQLPDEAKL